MLYLRLPISIESAGEVLSGEIYLPSRMRGVSICVNRADRDSSRRRICEMLGDIGMGTVLLSAPANLSSKHLVCAIDWIRAKRLLRKLPINIITTGMDAHAARKAAQRRPVAVKAVLSTAAAGAAVFAAAG